MLLWSINERLAGREGIDLPVLTNGWMRDVLAVLEDIAESGDYSSEQLDELEF